MKHITIFLLVLSCISACTSCTQPQQDVIAAQETANVSMVSNELDAIAMSLTIPDDILERSFPKLRGYAGSVLQSDNYGFDDIYLWFDRGTLQDLLNKLDYWEENPENFTTLEEMQSEMEYISQIKVEDAADMPSEDFELRKGKYILSEQYEFRPVIAERKEYDTKIIYIIKSEYRKFVVSFDVDTNKSNQKLYITDYKVVECR